ncbi:sulfite:cytochrome C oxidoreductase subunit B [Achromobacter aloeverae]|uniref:Sulfite:cytochrome C oxidoreductase subunit B n=1 Tax=Achromobacter aloeverae TaxID=1750518 RepID=A0A4V1MRE2_9BURK|nr:sulfite:cytochrome C oxidoreductase subunit B [Achromobacter aloeverae]
MTCCAACGLLASGAACALDVQLPQETATLRPSSLPGAANAAQCLMCHSADYMSSQPPMGKSFWEAEVNKMIKTYGAPIPVDQVSAITEYLNSVYGADAQKPAK